jgi:hypothetical protein
MSQRNSERMRQARRARDKLVDRFGKHPDVLLIDISAASEAPGQLVLRIHVRERWMQARPEARLRFPTQVDGLRVVVTPGGDVRPETA